MAITFDILDYLSGLTGFVFDKSVLTRIALERGVSEIDTFAEMTEKQRDLCRADLLYTAYVSPNVTASHSISHGSFKKAVGAQTLQDSEKLYNIFYSIYKKYDDPMLDELDGLTGINIITNVEINDCNDVYGTLLP